MSLLALKTVSVYTYEVCGILRPDSGDERICLQAPESGEFRTQLIVYHMGVFLKKLFRLLIAVFCIFFALLAAPPAARPVVESVFRETAGVFREGIVVLSEYAHEITGFTPVLAEKNSPGTDPDGEGSSGSAEAAEYPPDPGGQDGSSPDIYEDGSASAGLEGASGSGTESADGSAEIYQDGDEAGYADGSDQVIENGGEAGYADGSDVNSESNGNAGAGGMPGSDGAEASGQDSADAAGQEQVQEQVYVRGPVADEEIVYYYYTQISQEERLLYDAMLALAQNQYNDGSYEESRLVSLDPSSEEFSISYTRAFNALVNDHPELFWVSMSRAVYQCRYYVLPSFGGQYKVIFSLVFPEAGEEGSGYSGMDLRNQYTEEQNQLRSAADVLLGQVDFTQSDAGIALQLHDLLLNCAWYNRGAGFDDYAHTAYGALVCDSSGNPGGALCDGYSLAYVYLLERAGLTAAMVSGNAGSADGELEKHAWNIVCLDNAWYEVDATWDDLDFEVSPSEEGYDLLMEALSNEAYMAKIRHYMFNRTTEETSSFTPGEEYRYTSDRGWVSLLQPSVHIRFSESESESTRDYITPLAPLAEGTYYTWSMLSGQ